MHFVKLPKRRDPVQDVVHSPLKKVFREEEDRQLRPLGPPAERVEMQRLAQSYYAGGWNQSTQPDRDERANHFGVENQVDEIESE